MEPASFAFRRRSCDKPQRCSLLGMSSSISTRRALCATHMAEVELGPPRNRHLLRFAGGRVISRSAAHFGNVEFHLDTASSAQPTWPSWNSALHGAAGSGFCLLPCALLVGRQSIARQYRVLARLLPLTSARLCGKVRDLIYTLINRFSEEQDGGQLTSSQETRQAGREAPQSQCKPALHGSYLHQERCKSDRRQGSGKSPGRLHCCRSGHRPHGRQGHHRQEQGRSSQEPPERTHQGPGYRRLIAFCRYRKTGFKPVFLCLGFGCACVWTLRTEGGAPTQIHQRKPTLLEEHP